MMAIDCIERIVDTKIADAGCKFCLVTADKLPMRIDGSAARTNCVSDFRDLIDLLRCKNLSDYAGVGISIQASNVCAIDVDKCFSVPNDFTSIDERGKDIFHLFENLAYCEYSFSGTGLRIIFRAPLIDNYTDKYYIKNTKTQVEYYQPGKSFRYVTVTGNVIANNSLDYSPLLDAAIHQLLNTYLKKPIVKKPVSRIMDKDTRSFGDLLLAIKRDYYKDPHLQDCWFEPAPGSGKNESERDYFLVAYLYEHITQDKDTIRQLFEESPFFASKDAQHMKKWNNQDYRYYNYMYDQIRRTHEL